jgi:acyl transferase domain-containing protein
MGRGHLESGVDPASVGYIEASALAALSASCGQEPPCALGTVTADVGHAGAASGLLSLIKAALCLHQQILPPLREPAAGLRPENPSAFFIPRGPQFWLRDRADGPRRAGVNTVGVDGNCVHVVLEGYEPQASATTAERRQPLGSRPVALFAIEADDIEGLSRGVNELEELAATSPATPIEALARRWWQSRRNDPAKTLGLGILARESRPGHHDLAEVLGLARRRIEGRSTNGARALARSASRTRPGVHTAREPVGPRDLLER